MIDVVLCFANGAMVKSLIRPTFGDVMEVKDGMHPILAASHSAEAVPNDIFILPGKNVIIVTGPNGSGKSTYLKEVALVQILSQIGSFVPAGFCQVRVCDKLLARIGFDTDLHSNCSTFVQEVRIGPLISLNVFLRSFSDDTLSFRKQITEMRYIIDNVTDNSLVLIDEFGRGTTLEEGENLCFGVIKHLAKETRAFTLLVTHFLNITLLDNVIFNIQK